MKTKTHDPQSLTCNCKQCRDNWKATVKGLKPSPVPLTPSHTIEHGLAVEEMLEIREKAKRESKKED